MVTTTYPVLGVVTLRSKGGELREVPVIGYEKTNPKGLTVRWDFKNYTLLLYPNQLVYITGNRIKKRYNWSAADIDAVRMLYDTLAVSDI